MNHIMVVFDREREYTEKLVDYLNLKEEFPFEVRGFSEWELLKEFLEKQHAEVALCDMSVLDKIEEYGDIKIIILQDHHMDEFSEYDRLWKYQSCEEMIYQMMEILSKSDLECKYIGRKKRLKMIGFYSPVKRNLQSTFALSLGQHLGKRVKTLYVSLESCSCLEELLQIEFKKDLSDIMYDMQTSIKEEFYFASVISKYQELYMLPGMNNQNDLLAISAEEWLAFLKKLEEETSYEYILLDLSDGVQGLYEILRQCQRVYEVQLKNKVSQLKLDKYHNQLKQSGYEDVIEHIKEYSVPFYDNYELSENREQYSEFEDYVRSMLKDEFYAER